VWDQLMQHGEARSGGPSGKQLPAVDLGHTANSSTTTTCI
jgi:hypothetical protein